MAKTNNAPPFPFPEPPERQVLPGDVDTLIREATYQTKWDGFEPDQSALLEHAENNGTEFFNRLQEDPAFRSFVKDYAARPGTYGWPLEQLVGKWRCSIFLWGSRGGGLVVTAQLESPEWKDHLKKVNERAFAKEGAVARQSYSPDLLARHHGIRPMKEFQPVQTYDTSTVTDYLGKGLDENVTQLIGLLNELGLRTDGSCGGHSDGRTPYIDFHIEDFDRVIALLQAWKNADGLQYLLQSHGPASSSFKVTAGYRIPTRVIQEDLQCLAEFLNRKMHGVRPARATVHGLQHNIIRLLQDCIRTWRRSN